MINNADTLKGAAIRAKPAYAGSIIYIIYVMYYVF